MSLGPWKASGEVPENVFEWLGVPLFFPKLSCLWALKPLLIVKHSTVRRVILGRSALKTLLNETSYML